MILQNKCVNDRNSKANGKSGEGLGEVLPRGRPGVGDLSIDIRRVWQSQATA